MKGQLQPHSHSVAFIQILPVTEKHIETRHSLNILYAFTVEMPYVNGVECLNNERLDSTRASMRV